MNKKKSVFVTVIVSAMLAIIIFATSKLCVPVFAALVVFFAGVGFVFSATTFCRWLEMPTEEKEDIDLPIFGTEESENFDCNSIITEIKGE